MEWTDSEIILNFKRVAQGTLMAHVFSGRGCPPASCVALFLFKGVVGI